MILIQNKFQKLIRKHKVIIAFAVFTICGIWIYFDDIRKKYLDIRYEDISCHYSYSHENDSLPSLFPTPALKTIFFHETSCKGYLNSRQACSVESAVRSNPNWDIFVLFAAPVPIESLTLPAMNILQSFPKVKFFRVHIVDYAKGTPLESLVRDGALNASWYKISHTSDVLRYLTLYKWGGVYMDLDVIVVKSFDTLETNWAARESDNAVAAGALSFSRDRIGRRVAEAAIRDLQMNFNGRDWSNNGPGVISRVLAKECSSYRPALWNHKVCGGFEVYGPSYFYPVYWMDHASLFEEHADIEVDSDNIYSYHFWNKITYKSKMGKYSLYVELAKKHCPIVYEAYGDSFGS